MARRLCSEPGRTALKQYLDNVVVYRTVTPEMKADAEAFELGQTAMFIRESWVIGDIAKKAPGLKYATAPLPKGTLMVPVDLYVPNKGPKSQIAWDFVQKANEPENLLWLLENTAWVPNRKGLDYSAILKKIPQLGAFVDVPADYAFFTVPAISPASEILTRRCGTAGEGIHRQVAGGQRCRDRCFPEVCGRGKRQDPRPGRPAGQTLDLHRQATH